MMNSLDNANLISYGHMMNYGSVRLNGSVAVVGFALMVIVTGSLPAHGETQEAPAVTPSDEQYTRLTINLSLLPGVSGADLAAALSGRRIVSRFSYGLLASSHARVEGFAVNSVWNAHSERVRGVHMAGLVNITDDLSGAQVSGLVNRAVKVDGAQIAGIVNVAETLEGVQVGLINVSGTTR